MGNIIDSFGDLDLFEELNASICDGDEPEPETIPTPGSAHLVVKDTSVALFTSVEWTIVATVGQHELGRSTTVGHSHSDPYIKRWTRQLIRQNKARLRRLGVDVETTYMQWGGTIDDLDD